MSAVLAAASPIPTAAAGNGAPVRRARSAPRTSAAPKAMAAGATRRRQLRAGQVAGGFEPRPRRIGDRADRGGHAEPKIAGAHSRGPGRRRQRVEKERLVSGERRRRGSCRRAFRRIGAPEVESRRIDSTAIDDSRARILGLDREHPPPRQVEDRRHKMGRAKRPIAEKADLDRARRLGGDHRPLPAPIADRAPPDHDEREKRQHPPGTAEESSADPRERARAREKLRRPAQGDGHRLRARGARVGGGTVHARDRSP